MSLYADSKRNRFPLAARSSSSPHPSRFRLYAHRDCTHRIRLVRRAFLNSPHHAVMALATVGIGIGSGEPLGFIAGAAAYVLGWVFVPDLAFFRSWADRKERARAEADTQRELAEFRARRDALLDGLGQRQQQRYHALADICRNIERATENNADDPRLHKLEELLWTFLRLLTMEQSLELFLEMEVREDVPALAAEAQKEVADLEAETTTLRAAGPSPALDSAQRLLESRRELRSTLEKRHLRFDQAKRNLALALAEQERLEQQIKLIRADSIATRNASALSARIDATVEHLETTNRWLSEMDQFRDLLTDLPQSGARVGFGAPASITAAPPPLPGQNRGKQRT